MHYNLFFSSFWIHSSIIFFPILAIYATKEYFILGKTFFLFCLPLAFEVLLFINLFGIDFFGMDAGFIIYLVLSLVIFFSFYCFHHHCVYALVTLSTTIYQLLYYHCHTKFCQSSWKWEILTTVYQWLNSENQSIHHDAAAAVNDKCWGLYIGDSSTTVIILNQTIPYI